MRSGVITRIRFITAAVLILALLLILRLYQLQVMHGGAYEARAQEQYVYTASNLFDRGSIYFTPQGLQGGEPFPAASLEPGYLLAINPQQILDPVVTYGSIGEYIDMEREEFIDKASSEERTYQEIDRDLTEKDGEAIEAIDPKGVMLYRNQWRNYPGGDVAARTIGFVGYDGDDLVGRYGLERYYDDLLLRENDARTVDFFAELFTNIGSLVFDASDNTKAGDVYTSIEPTVSYRLDAVLEAVQEKWSSDTTGGIIINPNTGDIYALNVVPTYDLNDRSGVEISAFQNPLVESVYEMGSIIKPLTMASGIDAGAVTPQTTYYDPGCIDLDTYTICNYDQRGRGTVPMQEVLNQSLNTGVSWVVSQMGKDRFREYFKALKLGSETGIDLPGEVHGLVNNLDSPRDVEYATASFGQGIALTPIATVRALSTLANGGTLITPHIAQRIEYEDGDSREVGFPDGDRVFSEETSETITQMLVKVVDEALAHGDVALDRYSIAAKTGTAQIADESGGGYYEDRYLHSFFGYFPAYEPEFLIFLYTVEPKGARYASETLTDPFMELTKFLINYYNVPPDR